MDRDEITPASSHTAGIQAGRTDLKPSSYVCQSHNTLNDPWRNIGFSTTSFPDGPKNDLNLKKGWYSFTGIGGDRMVYSCPSTKSTPTAQNTTCAQKSITSLDCGGGLILYYLVPTNGLYASRKYLYNPETLGAESSWNEEALMAIFQQGLNRRLKEEQAIRELPSTLEGFYGVCIRLDTTCTLRLDPAKNSAMVDRLLPTSLWLVQHFLGFANFFQRFVRKSVPAPLTALTWKTPEPFRWTSEAQNIVRSRHR
ncbi:hypothetical protein AOLI_G00329880 [Acnodon oligacanthus]